MWKNENGNLGVWETIMIVGIIVIAAIFVSNLLGDEDNKEKEEETCKVGDSIPVTDRGDLEAIGGWQHTFAEGTEYETEVKATSLEDDYILLADIDLEGESFEPIGYEEENSYYNFRGLFDGNGYKIHNGKIEYPECDYIGIFASNRGTIKGVGVKDIEVVGNEVVGGLVGRNSGEIHTSYITNGYVKGDRLVGGLVGKNGDEIHNCYAKGEVEGRLHTGALVGVNGGSRVPWAEINNSYSVANIRMVGHSGGVTNSYWDIDNSERDDGPGEGRTTEQLKEPTEPNTEIDDEKVYEDWSEEIWDFRTPNQYPVLK